MVSVHFIGESFLGEKGKTVLMPAYAYYILIKSKQNERFIQHLEGAWFAIGLLTPLDEFYLLGKALQYGSRTFKAVRFSSVKSLATTRKIEVPV